MPTGVKIAAGFLYGVPVHTTTSRVCAPLRLQAICGATHDDALNAERCLILQYTIDSVSVLICPNPLVDRMRRHAVLLDLDYHEANAAASRPDFKIGQCAGDIANQEASTPPESTAICATGELD